MSGQVAVAVGFWPETHLLSETLYEIKFYITTVKFHMFNLSRVCLIINIYVMITDVWNYFMITDVWIGTVDIMAETKIYTSY